MLYWVHLAWTRFELTTLVVIRTDCLGWCKSKTTAQIFRWKWVGRGWQLCGILTDRCQLLKKLFNVVRVTLFILMNIWVCELFHTNSGRPARRAPLRSGETRSFVYTSELYFLHPGASLEWRGPSWSWSYGSWIHNNLCNQCLSPQKLWVRIQLRRGVLDAT